MKQKEIFLKTEGDKWYQRNLKALDERDYNLDVVANYVRNIFPNHNCRILEIGCSSGQRLKYLANQGYTVQGIEPSEIAVKKAASDGLNVFQGTADDLKVADKSIDVLIFGFCLYLADPADYFKIASESYRVLSNDGIIIINDFAPKVHYKNKYVHLDGVNSYKFDFTSILLTHPHLVLKSKTTEIHSNLKEDINNQDEWVQISIIGKHTNLF
jgi:SAM-dependent methyltransferase